MQNKKIAKCFDTTSFKALAGNGLSANVDGKTVVGGSMKFISSKISVDDNIKKLRQKNLLKTAKHRFCLWGIISFSV